LYRAAAGLAGFLQFLTSGAIDRPADNGRERSGTGDGQGSLHTRLQACRDKSRVRPSVPLLLCCIIQESIIVSTGKNPQAICLSRRDRNPRSKMRWKCRLAAKGKGFRGCLFRRSVRQMPVLPRNPKAFCFRPAMISRTVGTYAWEHLVDWGQGHAHGTRYTAFPVQRSIAVAGRRFKGSGGDIRRPLPSRMVAGIHNALSWPGTRTKTPTCSSASS